MQFVSGLIPFLLMLGLALEGEAVFNRVNLTDNAYNGLLVAINPEVPEDPQIVQTLKDMITEASQVLFSATHKRAYFGNVTILVPKTWINGTYNSTHAQSYDFADVLVASPNPMYGDNPYTLQYGQCGEPGSYIHFTPYYLTNDTVVNDYGPRGKAFVHEWAHLRWGVFDEAHSDVSDPFYFDSQQNVQATRCPLGLDGQNVFYPDNDPINHRDCQTVSNGLPEEGCVFVPHATQNINASLLSHQFIEEVVEFCDDADPNSPTSTNNAHNTEAPNEQNRLCGMRSVWSVMRSSVDFNAANLPNDAITDVTPTFTVARARPFEKFVLVLDVSGSMGGDRMIDMQKAANLFITQYAPNGTKVGIVEFNSFAQELYRLVPIDENREQLADVIGKLVAGGGTCIGCGILEGLKVLEGDGEPAAGGHLIVLSDGGENETPFVRETRDDVLKAGAVVDSIFFGVTIANADMQSLSEETQGVWYFNDASDSGALIETFKELAYVNDGDPYNQIYQIYSQSFTVNQLDHFSETVLVDSTIGNNTVFTFSYVSGGTPFVLLYSPSYEKYCSEPLVSNCVALGAVDYVFNTVTFQLPGTAAVGEWIFEVTTISHSADVDVIVTSMASNRENPPMVVESGMSQVDASNLQPIVVYAAVSIAYAPVIEANVLATITTPSGLKFNLTLLDTGSAPDVRKYDGVYSRYFTEFIEVGRYSVQVEVTGLGNGTSSTFKAHRSAAAYNPGHIESDGTVVTNPKGPTTGSGNMLTTSDLDPFKRIVSPGGFSYTGAVVDPSVDVLPPGKVINLRAEQVDNQDLSRGVRLTFSAPGSDYDSGTARAYQIRFSYNSASELANNFKGGILVTKHMVSGGDILSPKSAGNEETMIVELVAVPENQDAMSVWFALRAYDDSNNTSPISNIAMMNVFVVPYAAPTTQPATEPVSSAETPTPQPITTTKSTTTTVGKSDTEKQLEVFQITTIVLAAVSLILVTALIATCVLKCRLDKQRKKFQRRINERLEMGAASQTASGGNEYRGFMRPEVTVGPGYPNSSYSK